MSAADLAALDGVLTRCVETDNHCWSWQGGSDNNGYAMARVHGSPKRLSRFAYEVLVAPIPPQLVLDHLCRNPTCINPDHLDPVTHRVNVLRGEGLTASQARQTECLRGHSLADARIAHGSRVCRTCTARPAAVSA